MRNRRYWGGDLDLGLSEGGKRLRLREEQRFLHMHVLGLSGKGKTSFLSSLIRQDILNKQGVCVIDPHGALYDDLIAFCAQYRLHQRRKVRVIDPRSPWCMSINPLWVPAGHHAADLAVGLLRPGHSRLHPLRSHPSPAQQERRAARLFYRAERGAGD